MKRLHRSTGPALAALAAFSMWVAPNTVRAGGLELLPGGSRSVMRGGAVVARAEDPMVLVHNPAGLTALHGDRIMLNIEVTLHSMCFDPYGYYGWGVYAGDRSEFGDPLEVRLDSGGDPIVGATYATTELPEVCNSAETLPQPQLAWAVELNDDWAIGFGFVAPTVVPGMRFGGEDGTISIDGQSFPTPTRYQMIEQKIDFAFVPSFGLAYDVADWLALGVNLQLAMVSARTMAIQNATSGTQPSSDWFAEVSATDLFIPALTFGAMVKPTESLTFGATFRWVDGLEGSGDITYETNTFHQGSTEPGEPVPFENDPVTLEDISVELPWALTVGVRYAGLLGGGGDAKDKNDDPMATERWDVELDATYNFGSFNDENRAKAGDDVLIISRVAGGGSALAPTEDLPEVKINRHQLDSVAVRLGGSYSVLPKMLQVHAGSFFESRGIEASYASIDSFAFARVGVGLGVMFRIDSVDLFAGYGHIFQETLEITSPPHQNVEDHDPDDVASGFDKRVGGSFNGLGVREGGYVLEDPSEPSKGDAVAKGQQASALPSPARPDRVINAGKYTASFDIISVGVQYRY